jgi:hypothetical protein
MPAIFAAEVCRNRYDSVRVPLLPDPGGSGSRRVDPSSIAVRLVDLPDFRGPARLDTRRSGPSTLQYITRRRVGESYNSMLACQHWHAPLRYVVCLGYTVAANAFGF